MKEDINISKEEFLNKCAITEAKFEELRKKSIVLAGKPEVMFYDSSLPFSAKVVVTAMAQNVQEKIRYRVENAEKLGNGNVELQINSYEVTIKDVDVSCKIIYRYKNASKYELDSTDNLHGRAYIKVKGQEVMYGIDLLSVNKAISWARKSVISLVFGKTVLYKNPRVALKMKPEEMDVYQKQIRSELQSDVMKCQLGDCNSELASKMELQLLQCLNSFLPSGGWKVKNQFTPSNDFLYTITKNNGKGKGTSSLVLKVIATEVEPEIYDFNIKLFSYYRNGELKRREKKGLIQRHIHVNFSWEKEDERYYLAICNDDRSELALVYQVDEFDFLSVMYIVERNFANLQRGSFKKTFESLDIAGKQFKIHPEKMVEPSKNYKW